MLVSGFQCQLTTLAPNSCSAEGLLSDYVALMSSCMTQSNGYRDVVESDRSQLLSLEIRQSRQF